jgi:signal transduction histidine kinase
MPAGVIIAEPRSGRILLGNELVQRIVSRPEELARRALALGDAYEAAEIEYEDRVLRVSATPIRGGAGELMASMVTVYDVTETRRADDARQILAEAGRALQSSLDHAATLSTVARLAVPKLAAGCIVELVDEGVRTRHVIVGDAPEPDRSTMVVPLAARDRTFGSLTLVAARGRRFVEHDRALAEELGRRAALAVDNARLYREAQDAVRAREAFLSIASHELKTPLTALQIQAQSLLRLAAAGRADPARTTAGAEKIVQHADRLGHIVDDLLDVSRILAGRLKFDFEHLDLSALARQVVTRLADVAARASCEINVTANAPVEGEWDRTRLEQVITNLLTNACKFGRGEAVDLAVEAAGDDAVITVRDRGIGISQEDQQRIFERYERAAGEAYAGTGLGLWIVRQIVDALGGSISVASQLGAGSTFTVKLPRRRR